MEISPELIWYTCSQNNSKYWIFLHSDPSSRVQTTPLVGKIVSKITSLISGLACKDPSFSFASTKKRKPSRYMYSFIMKVMGAYLLNRAHHLHWPQGHWWLSCDRTGFAETRHQGTSTAWYCLEMPSQRCTCTEREQRLHQCLRKTIMKVP